MGRFLPGLLAIILAVTFGVIAVLEVDRRADDDDLAGPTIPPATMTAQPLPSPSDITTPAPTLTLAPAQQPTSAPVPTTVRPSTAPPTVAPTIAPTVAPTVTPMPTVAPTPTPVPTATPAPSHIAGPTDDANGPLAHTGANPVPAGLLMLGAAVLAGRALRRRSSY